MRSFLFASFSVVLGGLLLGGCSGGSGSASTDNSSGANTTASGEKLSGSISIDGSTTVGPISSAIAEEFQGANAGVKVTVAESGTGGGFKKFANDEIDIAGASRPIEDKEVEACKAKGVEFVEIPIAFDGLSVVVNPKNSFLEDITPEELKKIWEANSKVKTWADVRPGFPAQPIKMFAPGADNGTYDYFSEAICGKKGNMRTDYQASAQPNTLVQGVSGDEYGLGFFGYAYYAQNEDKLKLLKVSGVAPSKETIESGSYAPLSRPLFWYVKKKSLDRPEVKAFVNYILTNGKSAITEVGYVALPDSAYESDKKLVQAMTTGTRFKSGETGVKIDDVLAREPK